jgi:hypothetical protein
VNELLDKLREHSKFSSHKNEEKRQTSNFGASSPKKRKMKNGGRALLGSKIRREK